MQNLYTEKQRIEQKTFDRIVKEKTQGKSLVVSERQPSFADYNGDVFFGAIASIDLVGKRILEIGCGSGEISVWFALQGAARVLGIDISEESIRIAHMRKHENALGDTVQFIACPGEMVPEPDGAFNIIFINVALHHLEVEQAIRECHRLLAPGGMFIAIEPLAQSLFIQKIREFSIIQHIYPIRRETVTEKILTMDDVACIKKTFESVSLTPYRICSPFLYKAKPIFHMLSRLLFFRERDSETRKQHCNRLFQHVDEILLRILPFLSFASRYSVIAARKSERSEKGFM